MKDTTGVKSDIKFSVKYILAYLVSIVLRIEILVFRYRLPWYCVLGAAHLICGLLAPVLYIAKELLGTGSKFHRFIVAHPKAGYLLIPITVPLWAFNWASDLIQKAEITIFANK